MYHLHREQLPLAERAAWLYQKARKGLLEARSAPAHRDRAGAGRGYWDSPDALERAIEDGLACDAVLFDDDPDPVELAATLSRRFAPPVLQDTEGESLMMCDATLRVHDPAALTER